MKQSKNKKPPKVSAQPNQTRTLLFIAAAANTLFLFIVIIKGFFSDSPTFAWLAVSLTLLLLGFCTELFGLAFLRALCRYLGSILLIALVIVGCIALPMVLYGTLIQNHLDYSIQDTATNIAIFISLGIGIVSSAYVFRWLHKRFPKFW